MRVFGEHLRETRKASGKTIAECANIFGVTQPAWTFWEQGTREPKLDTLVAIADFFGTTPDELLGLPSRGGSATARGDGAIAAAGSNIHIEVGKDDKPGEMKVCAKCPKVAALQTTLATILQAAKSGAAKLPRKK